MPDARCEKSLSNVCLKSWVQNCEKVPVNICKATEHRAFLKGGDLNPGERHSRDTRDDGTVMLCTLRAATVLSRDCRADFGRHLTKVVMSHSHAGCHSTIAGQTLFTGVWNPPLPLPPPPLKSPREQGCQCLG